MQASAGSGRPSLLSMDPFDPRHPFDPPADYLARYLDRLDKIRLPGTGPWTTSRYLGDATTRSAPTTCRARSDCGKLRSQGSTMECPRAFAEVGQPPRDGDARKRTRTSTAVRPLDPEPSVSTNFTIRAG